VDIDVLPRVNGCPRPHSQIIYAFLAFASVVCAFFIAVSRTRDYWYSCPDAVLFYDEDSLVGLGFSLAFSLVHRHNYSDILTGAIIGIASVFVSVNLYSLDFQVRSRHLCFPITSRSLTLLF
jgi:uncharacterized membrane protein YuzA (DUF378 family)